MKPRVLETLTLFSCLVCSPAFVPGFYVDSFSNTHKGRLLFTTCYDVHNDTAAGITFCQKTGGKPRFIPVSSIERVVIGADTFVAIERESVRREKGPVVDHDLFARVIVSGPVMLFSFCETDYHATMFTVKTMNAERYLVGLRDGRTFDLVPFAPADYLALMEKYFSADTVLLKEVRRASYIHKIENPEPGRITEYESVTPEQMRLFVEKFNSHARDRNGSR